LCPLKRCAMRVWLGAVAQLGERLVRNEEVSGSIPLSSTNKINHAVSRISLIIAVDFVDDDRSQYLLRRHLNL
jgi:hypothetical protein